MLTEPATTMTKIMYIQVEKQEKVGGVLVFFSCVSIRPSKHWQALGTEN